MNIRALIEPLSRKSQQARQAGQLAVPGDDRRSAAPTAHRQLSGRLLSHDCRDVARCTFANLKQVGRGRTTRLLKGF